MGSGPRFRSGSLAKQRLILPPRCLIGMEAVHLAGRSGGALDRSPRRTYSTNYLIDVANAIIVAVEATTAIRKAEVLAAKRMIERSMERFDLYPARVIA
jgi:hypothetical protein